jgi:hypothetical protein
MEAHRRTQAFVDFPLDEAVIVQAVRGQKWRANNQYLGNFCSRIDVNLDVFTSLRGLLPLASHEGYPGHHTEAVLKEQRLASLQRPFRESYIFTYTAGAALMKPWLQGTDRFSVFFRFLTEQLTPSALVKQEPEQEC